jgi:NADH:ubiquinone reductase (H+-translocating)
VPHTHIAILGGGFGGLYCARQLSRVPDAHITLVDRSNFHLFQPLLYQVATASLSPADIATPIRSVVRGRRNVEVWMAEARDIDVDGRRVILDDGTLTYDYLVVATGATHAYFGHDEWAEYAPGLKTIDDALDMRRRFLLAFETAEREADEATRRRLLTFVIIGAGPTGVELAGAMAEIARQVMPRDFRFIDTTSARIVLLEGAPRVLPTYPEELSAKAQRQLVKLGVEVRTGAFVTGLGDGYVQIGEERVGAETVFWAAGVAASPLGARLGVPLDRAGRVRVEPDCSLPGRPEVFVIGDLAHMPWPEEGAPERPDRIGAKSGQTTERTVPGVAQGAIQMGRFVARAIRADMKGRPRGRFRYRDKGSLATIGRAAAVADFGRVRLSGLPAWLVWVFVHILYLIGFRNRLLVMLQWAWAYIAFQRGIRLITGQQRVELARARTIAVEPRDRLS